ncbi:MAG TPA: DNA topoisomerase subunit B [Candidatus Paceibacterota bacterium]|nr:DNA topoisomerase subunit B [Candidatus Paceibacterota bacterium]HRZ34376.1 DNA topoisomerase subunit B [Candidatus Paceibacterota bacterium]
MTKKEQPQKSEKAPKNGAKNGLKKKGNGHLYNADEIVVLEGLEPVRKRPGMYIGTTGPEGLQHLVTEIFDNSRDEAMGGFADHIEVALLPNGYVRVADNGRGIPVDKHKQTKVSALETVMTTLHAGGKFGGEDSGYKVSGGLHGVGASVVNALSEHLIAEVHRDGKKYFQEYHIGKRKAAVKEIGKTDYTGTVITFKPDASIFETTEFDFKKIIEHLRLQAYLVKGLRITVIDAKEHKDKINLDEVLYVTETDAPVLSKTFYFEGGLASLVSFKNKFLKPVHRNIFYVDKADADSKVEVEVALQYVDDISPRLTAFANNIYNSEGGTHLTGFKTALTRSLNNYGKKNNLIKEADGGFTGDDALEGITAVVSVKMADIQFEGQTKSKLGSTEARGAVEAVFSDAFNAFLEEHPDDARSIINKVVLALRARKAAKAAKDSVLRKGALEGMTLPGKLADCQTKSAEESELFIVEGDSAGGTAKTGRDRRTQAVLPLRGKILNVERARLDRMLTSEQIKNLVVAMGTAIGDTFDLAKLRYHKIIIATDADVDGAHIRTLLLTLFYRYFKPIIDGGYLYIAQPPLYKISRGKEIHYAFSDEEKNKLIGKNAEILDEETDANSAPAEELGDEAGDKNAAAKKPETKWRIQRYKGLGEMNSEELAETTMSVKNRVLKKVTIEDAIEADSIFDMLMGTDVPARKFYITNNAKYADLDI